jgi:transposase
VKVSSEGFRTIPVMPQNFLECDREQPFLMPPDPRDWLPEGHLAWFVLASVEQMDLSAFFAAYRCDGWGRAAFEPSMMVSLLLYAYARGERSSRGIERKCVEDVAYRVIAAQQKPDHATIARFRARHEDALAELFGCAWVVQAGGVGEGRGDRDRRNEGSRECLASLKPRL